MSRLPLLQRFVHTGLPAFPKAQMLIRRPAAQVFEALVDPAITSRFWFSKGSGRLEAGKQVRWDWEMYGFSTNAGKPFWSTASS